MGNTRNAGLDIIKASAVFFVLSVHFFLNTNFYQTCVGGKSMYLQVFLRMVFIICVPLFMIITGYLQNNKQPEKSYFKKIIPIITLYLFYSILCIVFRTAVLREHKLIIQWIYEIETFTADPYAWYVEMYIGLFLMSPFFNLIYNNLREKKQKNVLIGVGIFLTACPQFFNRKLMMLVNFPNYWSIMYPVVYYFIGCYIKEFNPKFKKPRLLVLFVLINLFDTVLEIWWANGGNFKSYVGYYGSLPIMIQAVVFFLIFYDIKIKNKLFIKAVSIISVLSLDIYLVTYITDKVVYKILFKYFFTSQQKVVLLFLPVVFCTFILAFIISFIRNYIVRIRKNSVLKTENNVVVKQP